MAKYKNLEELAKGFKAGELKDWILILDNDNTYLSWEGDYPPGIDLDSMAADEFIDRKMEEGKKLYAGGNGYYDLAEAMTAAGIKCEWV